MNEHEACLILNAIDVGNLRLRRMIGYFGSAARVLGLGKDVLQAEAGLPSDTARKISEFPKDKFLKSEYNLITQNKITLVLEKDGLYPAQLKEIPDAPVVLYARGDLRVCRPLSLAVVGSRLASVYGMSMAERFSVRLAEMGITIVSGMARGIDTAAHRGALRAGGSTAAVLGSGLACVYPPENKPLFERIAATGVVISEFPMQAQPMPYNFPRRNRVISGLSLGVIVVEAAMKSGALLTAKFALEQGREVFAVPGPVDRPNAKGAHQLLKEGAKLAGCVEDILEELAPQMRECLKEPQPAPEQAAGGNRILKYLGPEPVHVDALSEKSGLSGPDLLPALLDLELQRQVKQLPGKFFVRASKGS
ncbi:MAG: DNA-processing protein DprA [Candidatus Omnitrophota bacterium]|nr:DNA-processing protein DprA [Candidatus Omnitrophota bacterium]MDZ4242398.1 DNA-processing protein DprA [Candidatus Omnitrophota bacterium]